MSQNQPNDEDEINLFVEKEDDEQNSKSQTKTIKLRQRLLSEPPKFDPSPSTSSDTNHLHGKRPESRNRSSTTATKKPDGMKYLSRGASRAESIGLVSVAVSTDIRAGPLLPGEIVDTDSNIHEEVRLSMLEDDQEQSSKQQTQQPSNTNPLFESEQSIHEQTNAMSELEVLMKYVQKPSRLIVSYIIIIKQLSDLRYPNRNAKDATTQTSDKYLAPRKGGLDLPSSRMNPLDYLLAVNEEGIQNNVREDLTSKRRNEPRIKETSSIHEDGSKESVKDSIQNLRQEKRMKQKMEIENKRAKLTGFQRFLYDINRYIERKEKELAKGSGIWSKELKFIESRFGTGITSYFTLYRWVYEINIFLAIIWFAFIVVYGILQMSKQDGWGWEVFKRAHKLNNETIIFSIPSFRPANTTSLDLIAPIQVIDPNYLIQELFSGKGSFQRSFFFYGNYVDIIGSTYMTVAYLTVTVVFYVFSFLLIIRRMKKLFVSRAELSRNIVVDDVAPFGTAIFASWDYSVRERASLLNQNYAISTVLKTLISRIEVKEKEAELSKRDISMNILRRIIGNILVLAFLALGAFLIALSISIENPGTQIPGIADIANSISPAFAVIKNNQFISGSAFLISLINFIFPLIFAAIGSFERYTNPVVETSITLARTFVTKMASIYIILIGFYISGSYFNQVCWENSIGKTFYQLIWTNLIFTVVSNVAYGFGIRWAFGREKYHFGIADSILDIVYRQALIWVGTVYSPMTIVISVISSWIIFFVRMFVLVKCGLPPKRIYNSYQQNIYFLSFLLVTLALMSFPVFFGLTNLPPSCGPYGPDYYSPSLSSVYDVIPRSIQEMYSDSIRDTLSFFGTAGFIGPLVLILGLWVYYLLALGEKRFKKNKQLEFEVRSERADKRFLLRYYKVRM